MEVKAVGVAGAGVMGTGIAQTLSVAGYDVHVYDVSEEAVGGIKERISGGRYGLDAAVERGILTDSVAAAALARVRGGTEAADLFGSVDLVIEAAPEDLALKLEVFRELDSLAPPHAVLASNTSGFAISALAAVTARPEKVIGWHWASPPPVMRCAEIVVHATTSDDTASTVCSVALACGKNPQVIQDQSLSWGFVSNRLWLTLCREADRVVAEGVATPDQVDAIMKDCFRWPSGPFEMFAGAGSGWDSDNALPESESSKSLARQFMPYTFGSGSTTKA